MALDTERTLDDVLRALQPDGDGYGFDRTVVPLQLMTPRTPGWSRAPRRAAWPRGCTPSAAPSSTSRHADVGHGFADELFRASSLPTNSTRVDRAASCRWAWSPRVAAMIVERFRRIATTARRGVRPRGRP
jgi:hypothetical protein